MTAKYKKPCVDSSVFIGGLNEEICNGIKRGVVFEYVWQKAKDGEFQIFISAITIAEVYKKKNREKLPELLLDEFLQRINEPFVEVIEVDRECGIAAHNLCKQYAANKLLPNDAIQLACALRANCDFLLAWDRPLNTVKHPQVMIEEPCIYDPHLFTTSEKATEKEIAEYEALLKARSALPKPKKVAVQAKTTKRGEQWLKQNPKRNHTSADSKK